MPDGTGTGTGTGSVTFGLASYAGAVSGLHLQTVTYGETGSTAEAIAEDGSIEQVDIYAKKRTIQCEGNVVGGTSALAVGGTLEVGGSTFTIDNLSIKESVNGYKTATISGSAPIKDSGTGGGGNGGSGTGGGGTGN